MSQSCPVHLEPSPTFILQSADSIHSLDSKQPCKSRTRHYRRNEQGIPFPHQLSTTGSATLKGDMSYIGRSSSSLLHRAHTTTPTVQEGILPDIELSRKKLLGPHACEDQMPDNIHAALCRGPQQRKYKFLRSDGSYKLLLIGVNETPDLIPVLSRLCAYHPTAAQVWLCDGGVRYVSKQLPDEGGLCGYRNLQMLISYIQHAMPPDEHPFSGCVPTVIDMQEVIHKGWENGVNSHGLAETGGIRGTRKYIGTSEVETFLVMTGINCPTKYITSSPTQTAHEGLLNFVQSHFEARDNTIRGDAVVLTHRPPIYLQHQGHSMTIVGLMLNDDNTRDLLVFDPSFEPVHEVLDIQRSQLSGPPSNLTELLKVYLRGAKYLANYNEFELLTVLVNRGNLRNLQRPDLWQRRTRTP